MWSDFVRINSLIGVPSNKGLQLTKELPSIM